MKVTGRSLANLHGWAVAPRDPAPLFQQIYNQIRGSILTRTLRPGTQLPSTRALASMLSVSRSSVVTAYEQLTAEGYIAGRVGSGSYVTAPVFPAAARRQKAKPVHIPAGVSFENFVDVTTRQDPRPFNLGRTLLDARSTNAWRKLSARALRRFDSTHLGYSDPRGLPALRQNLRDYLRAARGLRCTEDQIVITSGTQHAVDLVLRVLKLAGESVWVEDPGYPLTTRALVAIGAKVRGIPVDGEGLDVKAGLRIAPKARAAFITPSHQFPTGAVMSMSRRLQLLAWARENDAFVVEDDYTSEFRYGGPPLSALQGLDEDERTLYIGTLNKALFPGLRLGYLVLPARLIQAFVTARYLSDRQPASLSQIVTADFMADGHFATHIRRMRVQYREQRDVLVARLAPKLAGIATITPPDQGMHLVVNLATGRNDVAAVQTALKHGVIARPTSGLYISAKPRHALLLGFSGFPVDAIPGAASRLVEALRAT